jgi:hypothetical protein
MRILKMEDGTSRFDEFLVCVVLARYADLVCCANSRTRADKSEASVLVLMYEEQIVDEGDASVLKTQTLKWAN